MEINKSCLDCKFANWGRLIEGNGECEWVPNLTTRPQWAHKDAVGPHLAPQARVEKIISKIRPWIDCPAWEAKDSNPLPRKLNRGSDD